VDLEEFLKFEVETTSLSLQTTSTKTKHFSVQTSVENKIKPNYKEILTKIKEEKEEKNSLLKSRT
jgi:hypothetical protein